MGVLSRRAKKVPDDPKSVLGLRAIRLALDWMERSLEMTPALRDKTNIHRGLEVTWTKTDAYYPEDVVARARTLYDKWQAESWGATATVEAEDEDDDDESPARNGAAGGGDEAPLPTAQVVLPAADDPVFGPGGMLYGVVKRRGPKGGVTYIRNPTLPKVEYKIYGHNNIEPGTWYVTNPTTLPPHFPSSE